MAAILGPSFLPRLEQLLKQLGVLYGVVGVVVVHERMDFLRRPLHLLDARYPLRKLLVLVVMAKAQIWWRSFDIPRLMVAAVQADDRQAARGHLGHGRHARPVTLRHVHCDEWDVPRAKESERPIDVTRVQPFRPAELDRDLKAEHPLLALLDVGEGARRGQEPGRKLKEDCAELARRAERLERLAKSFP